MQTKKAPKRRQDERGRFLSPFQGFVCLSLLELFYMYLLITVVLYTHRHSNGTHLNRGRADIINKKGLTAQFFITNSVITM